MSRPTYALIDLTALEHNLAVVRLHAPHARIMAVIKANAYGHGLLNAANALRHADGFAMLEIDAAISLRNAGYRQPILLLEGFFSTMELALFEQYHLTAVIHHNNQLTMLETSRHRKLDVFLKINTGMNRLGFTPEQFPSVLRILEANASINNITLMTHFSSAGDSNGGADFSKELQCFNTVTTGYNQPRSLANSAAIMRYPATHADWVRPGIMLYGASPLANKTATELDLHPVMTVSSEIIAIQNLEMGDKVGYSGLFEANRSMRIGIVSCGYADGYPRHAPTGTPVLVNNQRTQIIGRVSMDMIAIDITGIEDAQINSRVTLWGEGLPIDEVANSAGTISYELLCALAPRVEVRVHNTAKNYTRGDIN